MPFIATSSPSPAFALSSLHLRPNPSTFTHNPLTSQQCRRRTFSFRPIPVTRSYPCATALSNPKLHSASDSDDDHDGDAHHQLKQQQQQQHSSSNGTSTLATTTTTTTTTNNNNNNHTSLHSSFSSTTVIPRKQPPLLRFARSLLQHWRLLLPALACAVIASVCAVVEPIQFGSILAIISSMQTATLTSTPSLSFIRQRLFKQVVVIGITYTVELVTTFIFISLAARTIDVAIRRLRESLFQATLSNDVAFFDHAGRSNVERTATLQLRLARQAFWDNLSEDRGIRAILEASMGVVMCIRLVGTVGIPVFCFFIPLIAMMVARLGLKCGRLNARVESKEADILSFISERMRGLTTLKAFGAERKEYSDLSTSLDDAQLTTRQFINTKSTTDCANRLNIYLTIMGFFIFGGHLVSIGMMSFQTFSSLVGFIWILNFSMQGLLFTFTDTAKASVALGSVYDMLDDAYKYNQQQQIHHCPPAQLPNVFQGHVSFRHVDFHYPSRPDAPVLRDISFDMYPGQTVALVGESGGGKSTIASLLCRFYRPSQGNITIDGLDVQCIPPEVYAKQLSVVDQEPFLFQGTIRDNIAYGLPDDNYTSKTIPYHYHDDDEIIRAAKEANAHDFIMKLTDGYNTIWHPGSNLSGGQRQRIAIARCLLKAPRILVLDEATSALDQESERAVQIALESIMHSRTTLIIAHRLSTVRSADVILFVKAGSIVERGTFDELYAIPDGYFRNLVDSSSALSLQTTASKN